MDYRSGIQEPVTNSSLGAANARKGTLPTRARCVRMEANTLAGRLVRHALLPNTPTGRKNFAGTLSSLSAARASSIANVTSISITKPGVREAEYAYAP